MSLHRVGKHCKWKKSTILWFVCFLVYIEYTAELVSVMLKYIVSMQVTCNTVLLSDSHIYLSLVLCIGCSQLGSQLYSWNTTQHWVLRGERSVCRCAVKQDARTILGNIVSYYDCQIKINYPISAETTNLNSALKCDIFCILSLSYPTSCLSRFV